MKKQRFPKVTLRAGIKAFDHMQKRIASHENWGEGVYPYPQPCVFLQMHWVEMLTAGCQDADFDTLVAVSGASALFAYQPKDFMPKYANLAIGMDQRIADATGFGYEWVDFADAEQAWAVIKETVDRGCAAKGWDWENRAFVGYQDAAKAADRKVYAVVDGPGTFSKWWTWQDFGDWVDRITKWKQNRLGRHTRRVRKAAAKRTALRVMEDLVKWSTAPPAACRKHFPKAAFGLDGIEAYAADCADVAKYRDWVMCHGINPQWTMRHSTTLYLQRVTEAKTFPAKTTVSIAAAAKDYKAAFDAWHEAYGLLGHGTTKRQRQGRTRREAAARFVRRALERERAGIAHLRRALAAERVRASTTH